jgi:hypothetical protein
LGSSSFAQEVSLCLSLGDDDYIYLGDVMGDNKITGKKMVYEALDIFVVGGFAAVIAYFEGLGAPEFLAVAGVLKICLSGFENWYKHRKD